MKGRKEAMMPIPMNRGLFGWRGVLGDYRAFRRQGYSRSMCFRSALNYWRWDLRHIMTWRGTAKPL